MGSWVDAVPNSVSTEGKELDSVTSEVLEKFKKSWDYAQNNHHARWLRNWKLDNSIRTDVGYEGITNTFVPMVTSTLDTLTAALVSGRPSIDFVPQDKLKYALSIQQNNDSAPDLRAINALFDYYWDKDNWDTKIIKFVRGMLREGTSSMHVYWDIDHPVLVNLPVRDLIIDPNLTDPNLLVLDPCDTYAGRRYFTTKEKLDSMKVADPETGKLKPRFQNTDKIFSDSKSDEQDDKSQKEMLSGSVSTDKDTIEVIEIWTGDKVQSIANRCVCIEDKENPYKVAATRRGDENPKGIIPFIVQRCFADESLIYGRSVVDPIAKPQELLNDITNQNTDAITWSINPLATIDPNFSDIMEGLKLLPGTVLPIAAEAFRWQIPPQIPNGAFNERLNIKNEIREASGADQIVKGIQADSGTTATEIKAQLNQSGQRFDLFIVMLEKEGFYQLAKIVFAMMQFLQTKQISVPVVTQSGPKFYTYNPSIFDQPFEPKIQLEARVTNMKQRDQMKYSEAYKAIIADPTNNLYQAKKILYPKMFDIDAQELDQIIGEQPPAIPPVAPPVGSPVPDQMQNAPVAQSMNPMMAGVA